MRIKSNGYVGINKLILHVFRCKWFLYYSQRFPSVPNKYVQSGSLTIGGTNANYGTGGNQWSLNTAGLMMECANYKVGHDGGTRLASLLNYDGPRNYMNIRKRDKRWGVSSTKINGNPIFQVVRGLIAVIGK